MSPQRTPSAAKVCAVCVLSPCVVCGACSLITSFDGLTGSPAGAADADAETASVGDATSEVASEAGCEAGQRACAGTCVDPSSDKANCGGCGVACSAAEGQSCNGGQCGSSCSGAFSTTQAICSNADACVDLTSTSSDCSGCGDDCGLFMPGSVCLSGACVCPTGSRQSGSSCLSAGLALLTNVGWTATSSVPAADSGDVVAANVLDGNECTRFSTGASQQTGDWLELDLGGPTVFDEVVLDGFLDPNDFPAPFSIFVSSDGTNWGAAVASGAGSATGNAVVSVTLPEQTARYVKVQLTASASNAWSVDELRIYSANPPPDTPVPLPRSQWNATASIGAATAQLALDGNPATHYTTGEAAAAGDWFQVDLGTFVTFDELTMNSYDSCFDSARTYTVSVSNDGMTWQELFMGDGTGPIVTATFPAQTTRYIRVELTMTYVQFWSIGEFNAYMPSH
jgi:F5/8 type C domain